MKQITLNARKIEELVWNTSDSTRVTRLPDQMGVSHFSYVINSS